MTLLKSFRTDFSIQKIRPKHFFFSLYHNKKKQREGIEKNVFGKMFADFQYEIYLLNIDEFETIFFRLNDIVLHWWTQNQHIFEYFFHINNKKLYLIIVIKLFSLFIYSYFQFSGNIKRMKIILRKYQIIFLFSYDFGYR